MKKGTSFLTFLGLVVAAGIVWITYPTVLESELKTFRALSPEDFKVIRASAITFAQENAAKGIVINPGHELSQVFELRCKSVPLMLVENGYDLLTLHVFGHADQRAPGIAHLESQMVTTFVPEVKPAKFGPVHVEPSGFEAFVMKHRDGIDVTQQCR
ncbi:hypothetical protein AB8E26_18000 [Stenotrophomonas rhizophila]|uniref:hypothetical protein n=1 Tax=Stenotrophomonas rhizophila TaxID=216778 RepID=UPI003511B8B6